MSMASKSSVGGISFGRLRFLVNNKVVLLTLLVGILGCSNLDGEGTTSGCKFVSLILTELRRSYITFHRFNEVRLICFIVVNTARKSEIESMVLVTIASIAARLVIHE
jgi:hypothetical protein